MCTYLKEAEQLARRPGRGRDQRRPARGGSTACGSPRGGSPAWRGVARTPRSPRGAEWRGPRGSPLGADWRGPPRLPAWLGVARPPADPGVARPPRLPAWRGLPRLPAWRGPARREGPTHALRARAALRAACLARRARSPPVRGAQIWGGGGCGQRRRRPPRVRR